MKEKNFTKNNTNVPNSKIRKKEETALIRVSDDVRRIIKFNAFKDDVSMKKKKKKLVLEDNEKRQKK